ncbi:hypothetical protein WJX72_008317 [[Myrmecia] bisecta]|uniref:N-alpha-acetyltransferase 40 n=1 Tax=[Myrmecia] bisecta TaxID=41462 RepID=A0AAW1R7S3_9CHLO
MPPSKSKPSKSKLKKELRKAETQKSQEITNLVKKANQITDLLNEYAAFRRYERNGLTCELRFYGSEELPKPLLEWAFRLCKTNMQALYEGVWGWGDSQKRQQLSDPGARFLLAFLPASAGQAEEAVAYVHFRFEVENDAPVVYIYELQLEERAQRKGLGQFLMKLVELAARKHHMHWLMLTVMKANTAAMQLYTKLGYGIDESSPGAVDPASQAGYEILSKHACSPGAYLQR